LANETAKIAINLGFVDPRETDFDSTVQEAKISYPADANLMSKLAGLGRKLVEYLKIKTKSLIGEGIAVDMKAVKKAVRSCQSSKYRKRINTLVNYDNFRNRAIWRSWLAVDAASAGGSWYPSKSTGNF